MDEEHLKVAFNDVDFCLKVMELGYRNLWTPYAEAIHLEFKSRGRDDDREKTERFSRETKYMRERWGDILDNDPYYSPNLTRYRDDFGYLTKGSMNIRLGRWGRIEYCLIEIFDYKQALSVTGFQQGASEQKRYHHALPRHKASQRHNWKGERDLMRKWQRGGVLATL